MSNNEGKPADLNGRLKELEDKIDQLLRTKAEYAEVIQKVRADRETVRIRLQEAYKAQLRDVAAKQEQVEARIAKGEVGTAQAEQEAEVLYSKREAIREQFHRTTGEHLEELSAQIGELKDRQVSAWGEARAEYARSVEELYEKRQLAREQLHESLHQQLEDLYRRLQSLDTRVSGVSGEMRTELEERREVLRAKRETVLEKLHGSMEAQLRDWDLRLEDLATRAAQATPDARTEYARAMDALRARREAARLRLHESMQAQLDEWDGRIRELRDRVKGTAPQSPLRAKYEKAAEALRDRRETLRSELHRSLDAQLKDLRTNIADVSAKATATAAEAGKDVRASYERSIETIRTREREVREKVRQSSEARLREWSERIEDLWGKMVEAESQAEVEMGKKYRDSLEVLQAKRETIAKKAERLKDTSGEAWDDIRHGVEDAWVELRHAFNAAASRLR